MRLRPSSVLAAAVLLALAACADQSILPVDAGVGPAPTLPQPQKSLIPTVDIAPAKGWNGARPSAAQGLDVSAMASGLDHPRWLHVLPNGDVLVAESNKPQTPETRKSGIKAWVMKKVMERAGAGVPSADRITLLRDADGDGLAETRSVFLKNLHSPFGMALVGETLYVANADGIVRFPYKAGATAIADAPVKVAPLPAGLNHHWTKNIIASKDGAKLYATVGSNSNVGENGMENEINRAAILEVDVRSGATRLFASGLRNPNGMAWEPQTGALWTVVNERDEIGNDLVPDYLTSVKEGGFYGWPYSYYGQHVDERVKPPRPDLVAKAIPPDYALGAHVAALGLTFAEGAKLGSQFANGAFIGQHGSWNRKPLSGYNVVFVPFAEGRPNGKPVPVLTGFVDGNGDALGRPVGVAIDKAGALLVADDVGNVVWRVRSVAR
ncbi:sorbosone dehydrogenase family protein [Massilia sp. Leaf139]|uniref:PQQ-dependent sugar dehydrogenase n=1 Tax=Massilia sp. Leaf139 TaxID=1736272 RepID=UPI0006FD54D6|nr:sorbosone dehydrogenase family protein [Massilia sp. Leaf139]KQQ87365.1 sorbosone dehydrogenase [Massilia sp. Leaf139]